MPVLSKRPGYASGMEEFADGISCSCSSVLRSGSRLNPFLQRHEDGALCARRMTSSLFPRSVNIGYLKIASHTALRDNAPFDPRDARCPRLSNPPSLSNSAKHETGGVPARSIGAWLIGARR